MSVRVLYRFDHSYLETYSVFLGFLFFLFITSCNKASKYGMTSDHQSVILDEINTLPVAHMIAQVRSKQLSIKDVQNKLLALIQENIVEKRMKDSSGREVLNLIIDSLERDYYVSDQINSFLKNTTVKDIGYPIKTNKTSEQLLMALEWVRSHGEEFITNLLNDRLYNGLSNAISSDELPILQAPSKNVFWGNENPAVSTAMLISIAATLGIKLDHTNMSSAATIYPFLNRDFRLPDELVPASYPLVYQGNMLLIGDYQYGGQRNRYPESSSKVDSQSQLLFGPEDCSSAVGKSTYCTTVQVNNLNANKIVKAYYDQDNLYHYIPTTCLQGKISDEQLRLIHPGNIYVVEGHTAIIATKLDHKCNVITLQFNRDININTKHKQLGGGLYEYDLCAKAKERPIYILRKELPCKEGSSLEYFLKRIQNRYEKIFPNGPVNKFGDCRIFYE